MSLPADEFTAQAFQFFQVSTDLRLDLAAIGELAHGIPLLACLLDQQDSSLLADAEVNRLRPQLECGTQPTG